MCSDLSPTEIANIHNDCLLFLTENYHKDFHREVSFENLLDSVGFIRDFLLNRIPTCRYSILCETEKLRKRIIEFGNDSENHSEYINILYSVPSLNRELHNSPLPYSLVSDITRLHEYALNGKISNPDFNLLFQKISHTDYGTLGNYCQKCMESVYNASKTFWKKHNIISKVAKQYPPDGWTCDDWASFCDALGALIGTLGGGVGSALSSIMMSWAAKRDCQERPQESV